MAKCKQEIFIRKKELHGPLNHVVLSFTHRISSQMIHISFTYLTPPSFLSLHCEPSDRARPRPHGEHHPPPRAHRPVYRFPHLGADEERPRVHRDVDGV